MIALASWGIVGCKRKVQCSPNQIEQIISYPTESLNSLLENMWIIGVDVSIKKPEHSQKRMISIWKL